MSFQGSTETIPNEPQQGVDIECEAGHKKRVYLSGMTYEMARDYAGLLDGTSSLYVIPPRESEYTSIGRCTYEGCHQLFRATPFGYVEN